MRTNKVYFRKTNKLLSSVALAAIFSLSFTGCGSDTVTDVADAIDEVITETADALDEVITDEASVTEDVVIDVDFTLFLTNDGYVNVETVSCTLSNGTETDCLQITSQNTPSDHEMGPWCPSHIDEGEEAGGIWLDDGVAYDVDGDFIVGLAEFYNDTNWKMYDNSGNVFKIETQEECEAAADPRNEDQEANFCIQCLPEWITDKVETFVIPITPIKLAEPLEFSEEGPVPGQVTLATRGIAFNGVKYDAPAFVENILDAYTIAPLDDAGGHINNGVGYHYHGDTGHSTHVVQTDTHAGMIGYALDGHGIFSELDSDGNEAVDLDDCRGHYDDIRGYHYHAAAIGDNELITCLAGAWVNE